MLKCRYGNQNSIINCRFNYNSWSIYIFIALVQVTIKNQLREYHKMSQLILLFILINNWFWMGHNFGVNKCFSYLVIFNKLT